MDAGRCVAEAVAVVRAGRPLAVVDVDAARCEVTADPDELSLAVRCLVENALEAASGRHDARPVRIRTRAEAKRCVIDVLDAGPGMSPERLADAQRAFFTTKDGHAGLGLNIAARVAGRYGGALEISANVDGGVRATLLLPRADS
jgi:C4-dicarboxylate-specific signal transduction histidine kinase